MKIIKNQINIDVIVKPMAITQQNRYISGNFYEYLQKFYWKTLANQI